MRLANRRLQPLGHLTAKARAAGATSGAQAAVNSKNIVGALDDAARGRQAPQARSRPAWQRCWTRLTITRSTCSV